MTIAKQGLTLVAITAAEETRFNVSSDVKSRQKKSKRKVQGVPQSQAAALPRHQEEAETDKTK